LLDYSFRQKKISFHIATLIEMKKFQTQSGYTIIQILSGRSNVFLLTNGIRNILIDTSSKRHWNKLEKRLTGLDIHHIDILILTHTHFDHAANANRIKRKYNALVFLHEKEASYLASGCNIIPAGTNIITRSIITLFANRVFSRLSYDPCQPDVLVGSSLDLKEFGFNAYIIHTPGHTEGSISLIVDNEIAIVGDTMFGISRWSVFPPFANDIIKMIESWGKLLETGCLLFIPAHGTANTRALVQKDFKKRRG
jgi:hydroxyacylglutathione hydrolase